MKTKLVTAVLALLVVAVPLCAQDFPANAPSREEVMKLLEVMHARQQMVQATNLMATPIKQQLRDGWLREHPNTSEKSLQKLDEAIDGAMNAVSTDEMMQTVADIYRRHLSKADVEAAIAFYQTPAGQHMLQKMPAIMKEVMEASAAKYDAKRDVIEERIAEALRELNEEQQQASPKK